MRTSPLGTRRFSLADQQRFAALSGDFNPLHVDSLEARRAMFGQLVVHGMHAVVWAVETYLARRGTQGLRRFSLRRLSATFAKPVFLGERVTAALTEPVDGSARIQVRNRTALLVDIVLSGAERPRVAWAKRVGGTLPSAPSARSLNDLPGLSGVVALSYDARRLRRAFPVSCSRLGAGVVARLLSLSRLVGMECPGLHSLFSSFDLELLAEHGAQDLRFVVERVDPRVSSVHIALRGTGLSGEVRAFVRPAPADQPRMAAVARVVSPTEFTGQRALIVGGSRGLGEVMAKIIAAGGGHPVITYLTGDAEARTVADEITRWGGTCDVVRLDVERPGTPLRRLARGGWSPTHVYYFATPRIFVRRSGRFDAPLLPRFLAVYVTGFSRTYDACREITRGPLRIFYPSSVALDDHVKELTEYAVAKAAGEMLCLHLDRFEVETRVFVDRLPRMNTDQTTTLLKTPAADTLDVLHALARKMAAL